MDRPENLAASRTAASRTAVGANRFNRAELAGAFGDLGTLIPLSSLMAGC
jgi:hypothetical protein